MGISSSPIHDSENIFELTTTQMKSFKQLFDSIKSNIPDTCLTVNKEGVRILKVDQAQTYLVDVFLDGDKFEHFYCDTGDEDTIEINLNADRLNSIFKCLSKDDKIIAFTMKKNAEQFGIIFNNGSGSQKFFELEVQNPDPLANIGEIRRETLEQYEYVVNIPTGELSKICRDFKNIHSEMVEIMCDGSTLQFSTNNARFVRKEQEDDDTLTFTKVPDDCDIGPYQGSFKFSTLCEFSKSHGSGENNIVEILLSRDKPLTLHYDIGTLGVMYIALAPFRQ